ncbi:MAG: efflux transporter outer membrane subunit [Cecembia sp.]
MKRALWFIGLLGLLAACKAGKPYQGVDFNIPIAERPAFGEEAAVEEINTLDLSKTGNANLIWWEYFNDPLLDTLIKTGLQYNRNVLMAAERIVQARKALKIQNAELLPRLGAQASAERGNFLFNQIGQVNELYIVGSGLNWEIDFWGKLRNLSDAARYRLLSSEFGLQSLQISLVSDVATTYFNWVQALEELEIAKSNLALRDSMHQIIIERFDKGIIQQTDVDQSNILRAIAAGAVPKFHRKSVQLENALSFLIGMSPMRFNKQFSLEQIKPDADIERYQAVDLLMNRPDVIAAEYQLMAQNSKVGAAKARMLPSISLDATLGIISDDFSTLNLQNPLWNIGGQLMGPVFFWGQIRRMVDMEQSKEFQALFNYENVVLNAWREVQDVKVEIRTLEEEIEIARDRKQSALSAQFLSGARYSQGVTSYLEFLESQRQAFDAELELVHLKQSLLSAYARFYKVMGGGPVRE